MYTSADGLPSQPIVDPVVAESRSGDACWGCESALPFLWDAPAMGLDLDVTGALPCPRADTN